MAQLPAPPPLLAHVYIGRRARARVIARSLAPIHVHGLKRHANSGRLHSCNLDDGNDDDDDDDDDDDEREESQVTKPAATDRGNSSFPVASRAWNGHMSDSAEGGSTAEWSGPSRSARDHQEARCHRCACEDTATNYGGWLFEDEPPPYASLVEPERHHPGWPYVLPGRPYEDAGEPRSIARPLVSIPLTSYGIFKIEPPRYPAASAVGRTTPLQMPQHPRLLVEAGPVVKSSTGTARKYGAILIAATVIIFLMALSLMVRFVTEKSLWRG